MGWHSCRRGAGSAAGQRRQFPIARCVPAGCKRTDGNGRYAILLLQLYGSLTVTINMTALPPGRYAVVLADAVGSPLAGQMGLVLAWDGAATAWKLAGLTVRPGKFDGHDGVWYWMRARELAANEPWSAWLSYDAARYLLLPVDFLSSPNLDKLRKEQSLIALSPQSQLPMSLPDGDRTWKIEAVGLDASLHEPISAWRMTRRVSPTRRRCGPKQLR